MSEKIYAVGTFNFDIDSIVKRAEQQRFNEANQKRQDGSSFRDSKVTWISKWPELEGYTTRLVNFVNNQNWQYQLDTIEPLQFSHYREGDYYDWHSDHHGSKYINNKIRKISFAINLNEDYEGGEFEFTTLGGGKDVPTFNIINVNEKENMKKGSMIIFPSHIWHRVKPVTKGIRKSLVGWIVGNPFV
tara:strand:+ start:469 stop:1032 length:564 start_codon:yes stop_codon:yes gene_type:complete